MITYQDYEEAAKVSDESKRDFILNAINRHKGSDEYRIALDAEEYDKQQNSTIMSYIRYMYNALGRKVEDFTASNNKICSNFYHRLNTQRCVYLLGNGVSFTDHKKESIGGNGQKTVVDETKDKLGRKFDTALKKGGYNALKHGVSFGFWNFDHITFYTLLQFVPFWDEETSDLRGGIKFWQISADKPLMAILYEEDGYTRYRMTKEDTRFVEVEKKRGYMLTKTKTRDGGVESADYSNYDSFPIVPLWGSDLHQSTLVGMKGGIDAYDLVKSGFANDLDDVAQIYWLINGGNGMSEADVAKFRQKLKLNHMAVVDGENSSVTPYTQDIPHTARETFCASIRSQIYEDFGGLDVHTIAAGATNDHIDAAYQPMDEEADDFEYQVTEFIHGILDLIGVEDNPTFKRNRISNQQAQTGMVLSAAEYLDRETILNKLPFITVDEVAEVIARKDAEMEQQMEMAQALQGGGLGMAEEEPQEE